MWFFKKRPTPRPIDLGLDSMRFGDAIEIERADCSLYSSCRGTMTRGTLLYKVCVICAATDEEADVSDEIWDEIYGKFLYDEICHQGTLYPLTPIATFYICKKVKALGLRSQFLRKFLTSLSKTDDDAIYLSPQEMAMNQAGQLPMFKLSEIIDGQIRALIEVEPPEVKNPAERAP